MSHFINKNAFDDLFSVRFYWRPYVFLPLRFCRCWLTCTSQTKVHS
jgi:hypothetical protein